MTSTEVGERGAPRFRLTLPADPALALAARSFVVACSRFLQFEEERCEDLRFAANELFASASENGAGEVTLTIEADGSLTVEGVGDIEAASSDLPIRRGDLLRAMFPELRQSGSTIVIGHPEKEFA
jgi:hypothetical protein